MSFRSTRGRMICRIGSLVALIAFFLPWVTGPFLSIGYGLSGSIDQVHLSGVGLFEALDHPQLTLDGRTHTITGGLALSYTLLLDLICLLFSLGTSFYKSRTLVTAQKIAAALVGIGIFGAFVVVIVCAVCWASFKPLAFGGQQIGYFSVHFGAILSFLGNIAVALGSYKTLTAAKTNFGAPEEQSDESAAITVLDLNRLPLQPTVDETAHKQASIDTA